MPRRKVAIKREVLPDPVFQSPIIAKFINNIMKNGKKSIAEKIVYGALEILSEKVNKQGVQSGSREDDTGSSSTGSGMPAFGTKEFTIKVFEQSLDNTRPTVEVRSKRVGGATYQVPVEVRNDRSLALAMRWITDAARNRGEHGMIMRLAGELVDAYYNKGTAVKKRDDVHRMAKANQAFAHFRWN